jgi:hypothetical protein
VGFHVEGAGEKRDPLASITLIASGIWSLVFVVLAIFLVLLAR